VHDFSPFMVISTACVENHDMFMEVSSRLEDMARNICIQHGWQRNLRIGPPSTLAPTLSLGGPFVVFFFPFFALFLCIRATVCILVMQMLGVMLKYFK
jgi:hypothetical protein